MKKLSTILLLTGLLAGAIICFLNYRAASKYEASIIPLTQNETYIKAGEYTVFTTAAPHLAKGFELKDKNGNTAYTVAPPQQPHILYSTTTITTNSTVYNSFGDLEIKKAGLYTTTPIGKKAPYYLQDVSIQQKWLSTASVYAIIWSVSILIFSVGVILQIIIFIRKKTTLQHPTS
ncbi:hypothetical protein AM493_12825 [Flavobacterium akiainvivens]|uniref:Uncharacterized protein n=1 Tax=Flavobacterium akiainvivens TaxID=1202724 RepID=A0A0M9VIW2_9FLAO|nr:hypothetical protein [Flavobacterium akiainvivens]KOS06809.1 hypothetical protein AM493_12825 [Flavobacterium akiainvivens]SFQ75301.1 hypothetical protein SAMN05444144_12143 [Flavobacterium akiainvivens]